MGDSFSSPGRSQRGVSLDAGTRAHALAINLSGPAARRLLEGERERVLRATLERIAEQRAGLAAATGRRVPVLVKAAVSRHAPAIPLAARFCRELQFDGLIAAFADSLDGPGAPPEHAIRRVAQALGDDRTLIVVGGIRSEVQVRACLAAGADLVQVYRIYAEAGPAIVAALAARWEAIAD